MTAPSAKASVLAIEPYSPGRSNAAGFARPITLSSNENALGCSEAARAAYRDAAADLHLYPDSQAMALREAIAEKYAIEPNRILFGAGSDEVFSMVCQTYLEPDDNTIQPEFGFAAWAIAARAAGGTVKSAKERAYTVDVDACLKTIDARTRIIFVANPANPTGTSLPQSEITRLHAGVPADVLLVLDGAYAEYGPRELNNAYGIDLARNAGNLIVTRTFSKIYGLAALRIGWAYAPASVVEAIDRIRLPYNISRPAQAAATAALRDDAFVEKSRTHAQRGRKNLQALLTERGFDPIPSQTNFVTVRIPPRSGASALAVERRLSEQGVLVRALAGYGMKDHLRISIGTEPDLERFTEALDVAIATAIRGP